MSRGAFLQQVAAGETTPATATVAQVLAVGFLFLGAKLDELVQLIYRVSPNHLTPNAATAPKGWSADA